MASERATLPAILSVQRIAMRKHFIDGTSEWLLGSETRREALELPRPGVYTIEGANRSGKTALVSLIMGALRRDQVSGEDSLEVVVAGKKHSIRRVGDAVRAGMSAVFQRDDLIPTMTIEEQLLLRHIHHSWRDASIVALEWALHTLGPAWWIYQELRHGLLRSKKPLREEVVEKARKTLAYYPHDYGHILRSYPRELSHGEKAVARLLFAQSVEPCKVLFLDEAFSGVQRNVWPEIQDSLLEWQETGGVAIVVVTHNHEEIVRWNPANRFHLNETRIEEHGPKGHQVLVTGIPNRPDSYPVYRVNDFEALDWNSLTGQEGTYNALLIADTGIANHPATQELRAALKGVCSGSVVEVPVRGGELNKTVEVGVAVAERALESLRPRGGMIVVIGGGVAINVGVLVGGLVYRRQLPIVVVPTTIMAVADVAVGSKGSVNWIDPKSGRYWKHALGAYVNPTVVLLDKRYGDSLPREDTISGLSEVLKHGLLQEPLLFDDTLEYIHRDVRDSEHAMTLAERAMRLKARLLVGDPFEVAEARLALFGHVHAHSLERASKLSVPHGSSVYFGLLVELVLGGDKGVYAEVLEAVRQHKSWLCKDWAGIDQQVWRDAYDRDAYVSGGEISVVTVPKVGHYGPGGISMPSTRDVPWTEVWGAIQRVLAEVA